LRQQPLTALGLLGSLWCGCGRNILKNLHRNIQLCDGTANFWDGAVLLAAKPHKAQQNW